ncbi:MAG: hypothetical protein Q8P18_22720 [Pseudomonadota bacterium]|nr:hypothetical protein [Pseudomonadota bacterium]
MANGLPGLDFGSNWTPLTRNVIVTLFAIYVVQLLSGGVIQDLFAWQAFGAGFKPWQIVTAFLLGPTPLSAVLSWLVLFFVLAPVDNLLGRRGLLQALGVSWVCGVVASSLLLAAGFVSAPFMGLGPVVAVLITLFGFLMPNAQFLLMFIVPVRAIWLAWGTGLMSFLYMLYSRDLSSSLQFFAWTGAAVWMAVRNGGMRRVSLRWKRRQVERKLSRFQVIEGGRTAEKRPKGGGGPGDWVH